MRWGLKTKFIIYLIPLVVFLCFLFLGFFINRANILIKKQLTEKGFSLVKSLSYSSEIGVASGDPMFLKPYIDRIFQEKDVVFLAIYDKEGRVLIANEKTSTEEAMPESLVGEILSRKQTVQKESHTKQGQKFYDFYSPVFIREVSIIQESEIKEVRGFARVGLSLESINEQTRVIVLVGLVITFLIGILGILIAVFMASSRRALEEAKNVLEVKVKARTRELEELTNELENKVSERTKQLKECLEELERFHRLTVGRELKMIELKKALKGAQERIAGLEKPAKKQKVVNKKTN